ncbi:MAG: nuclear transport factor 2 family protein [Hydrogenophaga sp.]
MSHLFVSLGIVLTFVGVLFIGISGFTAESFALAAIVGVVGMLTALFVIDGLRASQRSTAQRNKPRKKRRRFNAYRIPVALAMGLAILLGTAFYLREPTDDSPASNILANAPVQRPAAPQAAESTSAMAPTIAAKEEGENPSAAVTDVAAAIETWRAAWEARDVERYLAAYSPDFQPADGLTLAAWRRQREVRIGRARELDITLDELDISVAGERATARFRQHYRSTGSQDTVRKQLTLVRTVGKWQVAAEAVE